MRTSEASPVRQTADACGGGDRPLDSLHLQPEDVPPQGPSEECLMAVAPAVAALGHPTSLTWWRLPPRCKVVVMALMQLGRDEAASKVQAAFDAMRASEGGRAVADVCGAATGGGLFLGEGYMEEVAADADLEGRLRELYCGNPFLPTLLAAAAFYRAQATTSEGAAVPARSAGGAVSE